MGNRSVKLSYLRSLPSDLKNELLFYITDIRNISQIPKLGIFTNWHGNIKRIDYGDCYNDEVHDIVMTIDEILQFKWLTVCQIPITTNNSSELSRLAKHPTLREFSITIPKEEISSDVDTVLMNILKMFEDFISNRGLITNMKIFICPHFHLNLDNVAPFFNQRYKSNAEFLRYGTLKVIADSFSRTDVKTLCYTPVVMLYKNGSLQTDSYFPHVIGYERFLDLLYNSGNLSSLLYTSNISYDKVDSVIRNYPLLNTIYLTGGNLVAHYNAFHLFCTNQHVTKIKYEPNIIETRNIDELKAHYGSCLLFDLLFVLQQTAVFHRNNSIHLVYPFNSNQLNKITNLLGIMSNIAEIGLYDNLETIGELDDLLTYLLERVSKVHIFTLKNEDVYRDLLDKFFGLISIEQR
jgi:hypothetical protein